MFRSRLNLLILLGIFCTGFSYEFRNTEIPFMAFVYLIVGLIVLKIRRDVRPRFWQIEGVLLFTAILIAYKFGDRYGPNRLIFVANALMIYQLFRLFLPMNNRQKKFALAVSVVHLAVGALAIVEPGRFIPVLLMALYLVPASFAEIDGHSYQKTAVGMPLKGSLLRLAGLGMLMLAFFAFFPRVPGVRNPAAAGLVPGGAAGPPEKKMNWDAPGAEGSSALLFRVTGESLGYLRVDSMDTYDGTNWSTSNWAKQKDGDRNMRTPPEEDMLFRKVKLFPKNAIGLSLPTDHHVVGLQSPIRWHVYVADHGGVTTTHEIPANLSYEYWTRKEAPVRDLENTRHFRRYVDLSSYEPSLRLRQWLGDLVNNEPDQKAVAKRLENYFQTNFEYQLGAPKLNQMDPLDDFIFNSQAGHCGRYASAMAILLRMRNIPSRVVRGFVPKEYNNFGEFYNIRAKDLHAWTEAWFPGEGWVAFDATPFGVEVPIERRGAASSLLEWIEDNWYAKVVEFNYEDQSAMMSSITVHASTIGSLALTKMPYLLVVLMVVSTILLAFQFNWRNLFARRGPRTRADIVREARHFYGQLLRILAKRKFQRQSNMTPREFLAFLQQQDHPEISAIERITTAFCDVRYGERDLDDDTRADVDSALKTIAASKAKASKT